jgi:hypothetical protein
MNQSTITGAMEIDTIGSDFDTVLAAWISTHPAVIGAEVACNDDSSGLQSKVSFPILAGSTYYFQVFAYGTGAGGNVQINARQLPEDLNPPEAISNLSASKGSQPGTVRLQWTSPRDTNSSGGIRKTVQYEVRYSTLGAILTGPTFNAAQISTSAPTSAYPPTPASTGTLETFFIGNLPERLNAGSGRWKRNLLT